MVDMPFSSQNLLWSCGLEGTNVLNLGLGTRVET